jgi:hypothetical protein
MKVILIRLAVWIILLWLAIYIIIGMRKNTVNWSSRSQYELQALAEVSMIYNSILSFRNDYGVNPLPQKLVGVNFSNVIYEIIIDAPESTEMQSLRLNNVGWLMPITNCDNNKGNLFLDPWCMPYYIKLSGMNEKPVVLGSRKIDSPVAVWSGGKNGRNELGEGDDISSWEIQKKKKQ